MKRLIIALFIFLMTSLACQTLLPTPSVTETPSALPATALPTIAATSTPLPTPAPITCTDDSCIHACLRRIDQTLSSTAYEPLSGAYAGDDIDLNLVYYEVKDGTLGPAHLLSAPDAFKPYQEDLNAHQTIWNYASGFLPADELKWIDEFEIFSSSNYWGWVRPGGRYHDDRSHWTLGIDISGAQDAVDLTYTLAHEYGHLITLNTEQVISTEYAYGWDQDSIGCSEFLSPEGCSTPDSYINLFYEKFWEGPLYEEWLADVEKPDYDDSDEFYAAVHDFYMKHRDQFIEEYAATNIKEDIAESFMNFVLEPKPDGNDAAEQKILFFYDFPELAGIRATMIQNVCSYTQ